MRKEGAEPGDAEGEGQGHLHTEHRQRDHSGFRDPESVCERKERSQGTQRERDRATCTEKTAAQAAVFAEAGVEIIQAHDIQVLGNGLPRSQAIVEQEGLQVGVTYGQGLGHVHRGTATGKHTGKKNLVLRF